LKKKSHFLKKSHLTSYYLCILDDFDKWIPFFLKFLWRKASTAFSVFHRNS
jgi:hypothetical protein